MFGVANRGSNAALAGKLASQNLTQAIANTTKYSPNAADIVMTGMETENIKKIAKIKNEAQRNYYEQTGQTRLDGWEAVDAAADSATSKNRMAGLLGTLGAVSYAGADMLWKKRNPPPPPVQRQSADSSGVLSQLEEAAQALETAKGKFKEGSDVKIKPIEEMIKEAMEANPFVPSTPSGTSVSMTNWEPLKSTVALSEGTLNEDGTIAYNKFYGGGQFNSFDKHPGIVNTTASGSSAAAGGFQFLPGTWNGVAAKLKLPDFSPASQDKAAIQLVKDRDVDPFAKITTLSQFKNTLHKLSPEWAGIPNKYGVSHYEGQNGNKAYPFNALRNHFETKAGYKLINDLI